MKPIEQLEARLQAGLPVILDGANGTELERLGARMDHSLWCARALVEHPDIVHEVHRRYIEAGADVITTNSFSATREAMQRYDLADQFEHWNRQAVRIARDERDRSARSDSVCVAGSVSTYGKFAELDAHALAGHFRAQGEVLVDAGVDLLILESLGSSARVVKSMLSATKDLGVPVWVSLSCARDRQSNEVMFGIEESTQAHDEPDIHGPLAGAVSDIMSGGGAALLMMHSVQDVTEEAVKIMRATYDGPVGAYPNAGYWTRPSWTFVDAVSPLAYLADARRWVDAGATIIGGCCGVGVEHIRAVAKGLKAI